MKIPDREGELQYLNPGIEGGRKGGKNGDAGEINKSKVNKGSVVREAKKEGETLLNS